MRFTWDDELLAAGHRSALAALGREGEAGTFTRRFVREKLPALRAPGAATRLDYGEELRDLLGPVGDRELERFLEAEHAAWRPARVLARGAHALLASIRARGLGLAVVANTWPDSPRLVRRELEELGIAARVDTIVLSGEVGVRKPERAIFERALAELDVAAAAALFVGDRLVDVQGASAAGLRTVQALWFNVDDAAVEIAPDYRAFAPVDVLEIVRTH